jgi:hypothetical protein
MRPQSTLRITLAAELIDGPGTCRELWRRIGCVAPLAAVRMVLANMVRAGDVLADQMVRVPGVRRPVPVYERALLDDDTDLDTADGGRGVHDLISCWAGLTRAPGAHAPAMQGAAV